MNIVELVKGYVGSDVVDQIASKLGLSESQAHSAVDAAVPAMLGGLAGVASTPDGARRLSNAVDDQDDGMLNNISGMLGNRGDSIISHGSAMLNRLMGGETLTGIANAISKFTGLSSGAMTSMLGGLAPVILGVLKKQKNSQGLDASGLAGLLHGQKQNVAAAMPEGLSNMLGNVPGLSSLRDWAGEKTAKGYAVVRDTTEAGRRTVSRTVTGTRTPAREPVGAGAGTTWMKWVLPLVLLGLVTWVAVNWMSNRNRPAPNTNQPSVTSPQPGVPQDNLGYVPPDDPQSITSELDSIASEATQTLSGVSDEASARQAAAKIQQINTRLDGLHDAYLALPANDRGDIAQAVNDIRSNLQTQYDRVLAVPGAAAVIQTPLNSMMQRLNAFMQE